MAAPDAETLKKACEVLASRDPALARACNSVGVPVWRHTDPAYHSLARTIVYQQISTKAAASIWERLQIWADGLPTPDQILSASEAELRGCGLSGPKIRHLTTIAEAVTSGDLPLADLHAMSDAEARKALIAVRGIGPWTADIYLMGALGRLDPFPHTDVGLIESLRLLQGADDRLSFREFEAHAETWRPWRAVAAHILWSYLNHLRQNSP